MMTNGSEERPLPDGWTWSTLGEVANPERNRVKPQEYATLPFIGMDDIESETMRLLGTKSSSEMKSSSEHFWPDDVLYGSLRPYLNKVYRPDFEGLCSAEFTIFRKSSRLNSKYLQYFLNQWLFVKFINRQNTGDRPRVKFGQMADYPFPLAPLSEQERIVAEIEKKFTRLDQAVASLRRLQGSLARYKASVLKAACEGRLVPQDPDDEPAADLLTRILAERRAQWQAANPGKKYQEVSGVETAVLPDLPEGWVYTRIGSFLGSKRPGMKTGPFGSMLKKHEHQNIGIPVLGIENIETMRFIIGSKIHITPQKAKELASYEALPGDILISRSGTVGEVCVVPEGLGEARISTNLMRIVLNQNVVDSTYFVYLFNGSPFVLKQISDLCSGSTRDFLNQKILKSIIFQLPPLAEQERIVAEVERRLSVVAATEQAIIANLSRAERLRQSILHRAFTGQLVPQDAM